jgi:hypothetical protein
MSGLFDLFRGHRGRATAKSPMVQLVPFTIGPTSAGPVGNSQDEIVAVISQHLELSRQRAGDVHAESH